VSPYGNAAPPDPDAPVAPPELIGASLFLGLVAVVSISSHGSYLISLLFGRAYFDALSVLGMALNAAGFAASLWYLALRRWAWALGLAYGAVEVGLRLFFALGDVAPGIAHPGVSGPARLLPAVGQVGLAVVFLLELAYMSSADSRTLLAAREAWRRRPGADAPTAAAGDPAAGIGDSAGSVAEPAGTKP
jgi:hypothetical protein